jgi:choline dehydrogenase-like flavoprotein/peptide methionine sulfoxide reductase MsrB
MALENLLCAGRLTVFAVEPDGQLARLAQLPRRDQGWSSWEDVGPAITSDPAAALNIDGRIEVFAAGVDGRLGHVWQVERPEYGWSGWEAVGPVITGSPVVTRNEDTKLEVFAAGPDGRLGHLYHLEPGGHSGWSHWEEIGPVITSKPVVFHNEDGHLEVLAAGPDGRLGHVWQKGGANAPDGWADWVEIGPVLTSDPAVFQNADGHLEILAAGPDGHLGHLWQNGPNAIEGWSEWAPLGPQISSAPAVFQNDDGRLEIFAADADGRLGSIWQNDPNAASGWSAWKVSERRILGAPAVFQNADGRLEVFAITDDERLGHMWQLSLNGHEGWSEWTPLELASSAHALAVLQAPDAGGTDPHEPPRVARSASPGPTGGKLKADVCVIGAGPAGITLSERLVQAGARVVVLESGTLDWQTEIQELNHGACSGQIIQDHWRYLREGRGRMVGGTAGRLGTIWSMPFRDHDYECRPWVAHSGWPLAPADLAGYEELAAESFGFAPFGPLKPDGRLVRLTYHYPPDPRVFRGKFVELLTNDLFHAELGATAVELKTDGDQVRSVRFATLSGDEGEVEADTIVLAAGGVENARMLLLNEDALPALSPMTGRCFMEHPHVLAGTVNLPEAAPLSSCLVHGETLDVLALPDDTMTEQQQLAVGVELQPIGALPPGLEGPADCRLYVRSEQAPNPDSRVLLGRRLDRLGLRRPILEWQLLDQDWEGVVRGAAAVATGLEEQYGAVTWMSVGLSKPWPMPPSGPANSAHSSWGFHHMGTTRMAADPVDGVVDPNCLVHGTSNLYVAGSSLFPTGSCANPTFMIVTLAHRLAEHLSSARAPQDQVAVPAA